MRNSCALAALVAALVLVPAGSALADETDPMNGMGCVHASGEGPDSLAAVSPAEGAGPVRAPSEEPIAPAAASSSAPASRPASQVTKPATKQVSRPATQVPVQRPATTTTRTTVTAMARSTVPAAGSTTVEPAVVATPRAHVKRVHHASRTTHRPAFERRFNGLEPKAAPRSPATSEPALGPARVAPRQGSPTGLIVAIALFGVAGAAVLVRRRRGASGVAIAVPDAPLAPSHHALVEAELHEIIAEERARELLSRERTDVD